MPATMLLAEDSVTIRRIIELTFADEDVTIVSVGDGESAIQQIEEDRPDIVLADVSMPKLDGYGVASYLKQSPARREIPVLLLTGAFEPIDEDRARESRCDGILVKPFDPQLLLARVKELLAGRHAYMAPPVDEPRAETAAPETLALAIPPALEIVAHSFGIHEPVPPPAQSLPIRQLAAPPGPSGGAGGRDVVAQLDGPDPDVPAAHEIESDPALAQQAAHGGLELEFDQIEAAFERRHPPEAQMRLGGVPDPAAWGHRPPAAPAVSAAAEGRSDLGPGRTARLTPRASLGNAFGALLAKEHSPGASLTTNAVSEAMVEELVRRVLTRMTEDAVRRLVADTAERVLREEIDRIRTDPH